MSIKPAVALLVVLLAGACSRGPDAPAEPTRPPAAESRTDGDRSQTTGPETVDPPGEAAPESDQPRETATAEPVRSENQQSGNTASEPADNNSAMDPDKVVPLAFAPGASSATVTGSITGFVLHDYVVRTFAGQTLTATLESDGPALIIVIDNGGYSPDAVRAMPATESRLLDVQADGQNEFEGWLWKGTLPRDGEYRVRVGHSGPAANAGSVSDYSLLVGIE
ncbi:MAG: hypothetical protein ACFB5Z_01215 [Elainellaceae cyanobacterium]